MKIIPNLNFRHANNYSRSLVAGNIYPATPATNQQDWEQLGKVFVPFNPKDVHFTGDSIMLESGDYTVVES